MTFTQFCETHGLLPGDLRFGKVWRCGTAQHPRSKNGAYFCDGRRGWCQNWETGEPWQWWSDEDQKPWSEADKLKWRRDQERARRARAELNRKAAAEAHQMIRAASLAPHPYLAAKGFPEHRGLVLKGALLVPMNSLGGDPRGAQQITPEGEGWVKRMLYGTRAKGAVYCMGSGPEWVLVEGYATGLSVDLALRSMGLRNVRTVVCFSAGNLVHVASLTEGKCWILADNDASGTGQRMASETGRPWVMSDRVGEDANDLHQRAGLWAVQAKINTVRAAL